MVILELIHASKLDFPEELQLLDPELTQGSPGLKLIHTNRANRVSRLANQVSDLSASDGRVLAYRGFDG